MMKRVLVGMLLVFSILTCKKQAAGPLGPPGGGGTGGSGGNAAYFADIQASFYTPDTLDVALWFYRLSNGDTFSVSPNAVWVGQDTLMALQAGQYFVSVPFTGSLRIGFQVGTDVVDTTITFSAIGQPAFIHPSQDTDLTAGDTLRVVISTPQRPFRFQMLVPPEPYTLILDTLLTDTTFHLPDSFLTIINQTYVLKALVYDTVLQGTTATGGVFWFRVGGETSILLNVVPPPTGGYTFQYDTVDVNDPTVTVEYPLIRWLPGDSIRTLTVEESTATGWNAIWQIQALASTPPDTGYRYFGPPVHYGAADTTRYAVNPYLPNPAPPLQRGGAYRIVLEFPDLTQVSDIYRP